MAGSRMSGQRVRTYPGHSRDRGHPDGCNALTLILATNPTTLVGSTADGISPDEADATITEMLRSGVVEGFVVHLAARFGSAPRGDVEDAVIDAVMDTRRRLESQVIDNVNSYVCRAASYLLGRNANRRRRLVQFRESADGPLALGPARGEVATVEIAAPRDSTETDEAIADRQDAALAFVREIVGAWPGSSQVTIYFLPRTASSQDDFRFATMPESLSS